MPYAVPISWIVAGMIVLTVLLWQRKVTRLRGIYLVTALSAILSGLNFVLPLWLVWMSVILTLLFILGLMGMASLTSQAENFGDTVGLIIMMLLTLTLMLYGVLGNFRPDMLGACCR